MSMKNYMCILYTIRRRCNTVFFFFSEALRQTIVGSKYFDQVLKKIILNFDLFKRKIESFN